MAEDPTGNDAIDPPRRRVPRLALAMWAVALAVVGGWMVTRGLGGDGWLGGESRPVLYDMPEFALTASDGTAVTRDDLLGGRAVVEFVFTRCKLFCPVMSIRMGELQAELASDPAMADVRLISITVDPEHDTLEVLADYAEKYAADPQRWSFLRGDDRDAVWRLVEEGFKLPVTDEPENSAMPIGHSGNWVIFDAAGQARALVPATQGPTVELAMQELRAIGDD